MAADPDIDVGRRADRRRRGRRTRRRRDGARQQEARRHRQQGADGEGTAPASPPRPRRPAWRSPSRRRSPAASRSSRHCARGSPATALSRVYGILNGTSNYILTTMRESGREFAEVLGRGAEARLCRGRSELRHRRGRRRAQAGDPGERRVRPAGRSRRRLYRGHPPHLAPRYRFRRGARLPHQAPRHRPADRERPGTARPSLHGAARHADRRGRGRLQRRRRRGRFRRAGRARRAAAPAPSRPPRRSSPTSSISPPAGTCRAFGVPAAALTDRCPARRWSATRAPTTSA